MAPQASAACWSPSSPRPCTTSSSWCEAAQGSTVFFERLDRHQLADKWVEVPIAGVFEVENGKIIYWRDYFDAGRLLSQWPSA